jgi:hypothetical protein
MGIVVSRRNRLLILVLVYCVSGRIKPDPLICYCIPPGTWVIFIRIRWQAMPPTAAGGGSHRHRTSDPGEINRSERGGVKK